MNSSTHNATSSVPQHQHDRDKNKPSEKNEEWLIWLLVGVLVVVIIIFIMLWIWCVKNKRARRSKKKGSSNRKDVSAKAAQAPKEDISKSKKSAKVDSESFPTNRGSEAVQEQALKQKPSTSSTTSPSMQDITITSELPSAHTVRTKSLFQESTGGPPGPGAAPEPQLSAPPSQQSETFHPDKAKPEEPQ